MRVKSENRKRELAHVRLGDDHSARGAQAAHDEGVLFRGRCIDQDLRARARRLARDVEQVLDADDRPIERAETDAGARTRIRGIGRGTRRFGVDGQARALAFAARVVDADERFLETIARGPVRPLKPMRPQSP
jgi:hypothetical protein